MGEEFVADQREAQQMKYLGHQGVSLGISQHPPQHGAEQLYLVPQLQMYFWFWFVSWGEAM